MANSNIPSPLGSHPRLAHRGGLSKLKCHLDIRCMVNYMFIYFCFFFIFIFFIFFFSFFFAVFNPNLSVSREGEQSQMGLKYMVIRMQYGLKMYAKKVKLRRRRVVKIRWSIFIDRSHDATDFIT